MDEEMSKNSDKEMEIDDDEPNIANSPDSDDENKAFSKRKKKARCLSDSDSETLQIDETEPLNNTNLNDDSPSITNGNGIESDSSDTDSRHLIGDDLSPDRQKSQRVENKNSMMSKKFEKLFQPKESHVENVEDYSNMKSKLSMLCDSDSSDDENFGSNSCEEFKTVPDYQNPKSSEEPKNRGTQRMSAKIAMEQMHKIKSESSRMLREKEISLPYHRPKQISLKDIMAKKNIQFVPGAKKPNLRMNEEQLKEYVLQLEKREKEIQELYESSSDDEKDNDNDVSCNTINEVVPEVLLPIDNANTEINENETQLIQSEDLPEASDSVENGVTIDSNQTESSLSHTDIGTENDNVNETEPNSSPIENHNESIVETEESASADIEKSLANIMDELEKVEKTISLIDNVENSETDSQSVLNSENNHIECLKTQLLSSLPSEPKLSGMSGEFIEFTTNGTDELNGVNAFKKKFFYHANLKTPIEIEREKEKKMNPGTALMNFRRELEDQIREQNLQEWKRKREESQTKNLEEKTEGGGLSDCEEILEKINDEEKQSDKDGDDSVKESETEIEDEIEDDCIMIDKKKSKEKCDYIEDEAELDDDSFEDDENDNEETDIESDVPDNNSQLLEKKKLNRIYNPFEGSDSSDDNDDSSSISKYGNKLFPDNKLYTKSTDTIPNKDSVDIFDGMEVDTLEQQKDKNLSMDCSSDDFLPLGQKSVSDESLISSNVNSYNTTSENLSSQVTNLNTSYLIELSSHIDQNKITIQEEQLSTVADQVKKQLNDTNVIDSVSYTQEIADLCSGNFTPKESNSDSKCPESLISSLNENGSSTQITQNTENELLELCTGQFIGIDEAGSEKQITSKIVSNSIIESENKSAQVVQKTEPKKKSKGIESFLVSCPVQTKNLPNDINIEDKVENISNHKHLILSSSSDEKEDCDETEKKKKRSLKSKRDRNKTRKAKPLEESDDESDIENENFDEDDKSSQISSLSNVDEEREINYDSEENEIEIVPEGVTAKPKTKKSSEFFEQEAELTTDDEWKGSGDEDERNLDEFEWEEGDADQLDHRKVNKELERIHRHQMLDQDSREIKILQDILLEDGDLEGGNRERKFRWKNIDNNIESGAVVGEENLDDFDDTQNEEQWRKQRYERETYLRELMNKETEQEEKEPSQIPTRLSIVKASLKQSLTSVQSEDFSVNLTLKQNVVIEQNNQETDKSNKKSMTVPSPIKKPFMCLQNQFKKSFLSKGQAALNRLSLLTKNLSNTNGENPSTNLSSLAPGKKKNFVFQTVSPPCNNNLTEDMKMKKRKAVSEITTPKIIKKMKLLENRVPKSRKSLIDHMD